MFKVSFLRVERREKKVCARKDGEASKRMLKQQQSCKPKTNIRLPLQREGRELFSHSLCPIMTSHVISIFCLLLKQRKAAIDGLIKLNFLKELNGVY